MTPRRYRVYAMTFVLMALGVLSHGLLLNGHIPFSRSARIHSRSGLVAPGEIDGQRGCANVLDNLGDLDERLGLLPAALERHNAALTILRTLNDRQGQLYVLNNIGIVRHKLGQLDEAAELQRDFLGNFLGAHPGHRELLIALHPDGETVNGRRRRVRHQRDRAIITFVK